MSYVHTNRTISGIDDITSIIALQKIKKATVKVNPASLKSFLNTLLPVAKLGATPLLGARKIGLKL